MYPLLTLRYGAACFNDALALTKGCTVIIDWNGDPALQWDLLHLYANGDTVAVHYGEGDKRAGSVMDWGNTTNGVRQLSQP